MPDFAEIILPLALPKPTYTYMVPEPLRSAVQVGCMVVVPLGARKHYAGIVYRRHDEAPSYPTKPILEVLSEGPVVGLQQLSFWEWLSAYYGCSLGEVMAAALPAQMKLSSETELVRHPAYEGDFSALDADEYLLAKALISRGVVSLAEAQQTLGKKNAVSVVRRLLTKGVLAVRESLREQYRPHKGYDIRLAEPYQSQPEQLDVLAKDLSRYPRQQGALSTYLSLSKSHSYVSKDLLLREANISPATLKVLVAKKVFELVERRQSRVPIYEGEVAPPDALSAEQQRALGEIRGFFKQRKPVLLYGVTGSGKTRVYIELIQQVIRSGGQVLYLLPEIALTAQIIRRLQRVFGQDVAVYHSKISDSQRTEIWHMAAAGCPIFLTARSGIFLPFQNLQLVIVDEEHDPSYKQQDPAPRYHARDSAIYLAGQYRANVLLGTATPSLESWYNAQSGKYGLVPMRERFGKIPMPDVHLVDLRRQHQQRQMYGLFSAPLLEALQQALKRGEQALLFQNRRGYSPILQCRSCGWTAECRHCDVSSTYHKHSDLLHCHYCGYTEKVPSLCPVCRQANLALLGAGTEKVEDEIKIYLPQARVARLDLDTAGSKQRLNDILCAFEERRIDILVGTQMITKGLDFDNVSVVGVLNADAIAHFPDFRASERTFQLLTQVAGRAGRKHKSGTVFVQAWNPTHPVFQEVARGNFETHAQRELLERRQFRYPPFVRLIRIRVRHPEENSARLVAHTAAEHLRQHALAQVVGPAPALISRIGGYFLWEILLKVEKSATALHATKEHLRRLLAQLVNEPGKNKGRLAIDVDPY